MTNIAMVFRWPIEIDGLPFEKMVDLSIVKCECHNQMVFPCVMPKFWPWGSMATIARGCLRNALPSGKLT